MFEACPRIAYHGVEQLQGQALQSYIRRGVSTRDEAHNSSSTDKKTGHRSSQVTSIFRQLSISSDVFFVTIGPKPSCNM